MSVEPGRPASADANRSNNPPTAEHVVAEASDLLDAAEQSQRLAWQVAVDAAGVGTFDWNATTGVLLWDERFATVFGYDHLERPPSGTAAFPQRVHPDDLPRVNAAIAEAVATHGEYTAEYRVVHPDGQIRWVACRGRVLADETGRAVRLLGAVYDITVARQAQERAERAARRAELVARVIVELTETLDADRAVGRLAGALVPALADWCIVSLVPDDEQVDPFQAYRLRDVAWAHVDPAAAPILERYLKIRTRAWTEENPVVRALRTGRASELPTDAARVLQSSLKEGPARDLIARLAPQAALILPLRARGRTIGLISLYNGPVRGAVPSGDVELLRDLAGQAGLALDNARLYRQQRRLAEGLQRAMLTEPPQVEHLDITVRYVPAGEAAQVGGDWYDAFIGADGTVTVVIGDVVGHDVVAAAAMGQLRSMLRAIAARTGDGPCAILHGLDTTMRTLRMALTATGVVAQIGQIDEDRAGIEKDRTGIEKDRAGKEASVRWSNAGHLPPLLLRADGTITDLSRPDADLLLGLDPDLPRTESGVTLHAGDTLLLYTDGLVERRGRSLSEGLLRLHQAIAGYHASDEPLDRLCDHLLLRLCPSDAHDEAFQDDVALIAVRLRP